MNNSVVLTVVIPTHRRHLVLRSALESVFRQKNVQFEVFVINGIEDDKDTDAVVAEFNAVKYIKSRKYLSCSAKRLLGLSIAKGLYLNFLDDDDYLIDDCFYQKAVEILDKNDKLAFVSGNSRVRRESFADIAPTYEEKPLPFAGVVNGLEYFSKLQIEWPKPHSTCPTIFRKSALLGAHPLKEVNDSSIYLRALLDGDAFILPDFVAVYRIWAQSISAGGEGNDLRLKMETMIQKEHFYYMAEAKIPDVKKWWRGTFAMNLRYFLSSMKDDREIVLLATWGILHAHGDEWVVSQCASALASACPSLFSRIAFIRRQPKVYLHLRALLHKRFLGSVAEYEPYYGMVMSELGDAVASNCGALDLGMLYYIGFRNFGDLLSCRLAEYLCGQRVFCRGIEIADFSAVGSLLQNLPKCLAAATSNSALYHVWGSGFLYPIPKQKAFPVGRVIVHAVRGENTLRLLREMGVVQPDEKVALGDPGLFYADLVPGVREAKKVYDIAIIPHHVDKKDFSHAVDVLLARGLSAKLIDVGHDNPFQVVRDIASARKVLSSSLHGIIVADSLGIPNKRLVIDDFDNDRVRALNESHYKFDDYYSAFGMSRPGHATLSELMESPEKVMASVVECVPKELVETCKRGLMAVFPFRDDRVVREASAEPPKVSVVIPVYNAEYYIRECLDSILRQPQFEDVEVICVDDGSSDSSIGIVESYGTIDSRVRLIRQEHEGPGVARNRGVDAARGEYILFLDSDDRLPSGRALANAYAQAHRFDLDLLLAQSRTINEYGNITKDSCYLTATLLPKTDCFSPTEALPGLFLSAIGAPWSKLYRRAFILEHAIRFPPLFRAEDFPFVRLSMALSSRIGVCPLSPLTDHRENRVGSLESTADKGSLVFVQSQIFLFSELKRRGVWERFAQAARTEAALHLYYDLLNRKTYLGFKEIYDHFDNIYRDFDLAKVDWTLKLPNLDKALSLIDRIRESRSINEFVFGLYIDVRRNAQRGNEEIAAQKRRCQNFAKEVERLKCEAERLRARETKATRNRRAAEHKVAAQARELAQLKASASYRIGLFVTWPLRRLYRAVKCYHENGFSYTVNRIIHGKKK